MRAVVQRVRQASVAVEGQVVGEIGQGLLVLIGVGQQDTQKEALWLAHKIANLRIFSDAEGKMNLSVKSIDGAILVISQFTLYGNIHKGFRPSFVDAAAPEIAEPLITDFIAALQSEEVPVESGIFRADMQVSLINDGPVTILMEK
ncbi:MAG: D-tyrosyl-tRNA(Tyr) deacylase [Anaerolineales bacterium]|nr:MAG: D-tyrosyl-tRNA(Tyr) deacylase [Anaerolineales bacterium]